MGIRSVSFPYGNFIVELSYRVRLGSGGAVVFLPGGGCEKECFAGAWSHPALRGRPLYAFDLAGHGDSTKSGLLGYTAREQANLFLRALDELQLAASNLVGHSFGGVVGALAAATEPSRFRTFTNIEGILLREGGALFGDGFLEAEYATFENELFPAFCAELANDGPVHKKWAGWLKRCDARAFYVAARSMVEMQKAGTLFKLYRDLSVEKHFVYGSQTPPEFVEKIEGIGERHRIERADHFPMLENRAGCYRTVGRIVR